MAWLDLAEVKRHLNKTSTTDDAEIQQKMAAAEAMIKELVGWVEPPAAPLAEYYRGGRSGLVLNESPVVSVALITVHGVAVPQANLDTGADGWYSEGLDLGAGIVRHTSWFPRGSVKVTYTPGRDPIPANFVLAGHELVKHLWQTTQHGSPVQNRPLALGNNENAGFLPHMGFALPNRVRELLGLGNRGTDEQLVG